MSVMSLRRARPPWRLPRLAALLACLALALAQPTPPAPATQAAPPPPPTLMPADRAKVEPGVWRSLAQAGEVSVLVHLAEAPFDTGRAEGEAVAKAEPAARKRAVVQKLAEHAQATQAGVRALLGEAQAKRGARDVEALWVVNAVAATVDRPTVEGLAARPDVVAIRANRVYRTEDLLGGERGGAVQAAAFTPQSPVRALPRRLPLLPSLPTLPSLSPLLWNLHQVGVDRVWDEWGLAGEGVTVATVDTGAQWTHPALRPSYLGASGDHNYAWFDATGESPAAPLDQNGHGTHVLGILVGDDGQTRTGVAPGARWMAVRVFGAAGSSDLIIHRAFQWLLAPTDLAGGHPDPARAPAVVNLSWGHPNGAKDSYAADVRRLREAGIVQVFAAGNGGSLGEGTVSSPGSLDLAFAVGNTTPDDRLNPSSGLGPGFSGGVKPDLAAPGTGILSTVPVDQFAVQEGTSMAAPHVAGTAALMRQANPRLSVADVEQLLRLTAVDLGPPGPDNQFGAGRLDAYAAVGWARSAGQMEGRIDSGEAGLAAGASVRGVREGGGAVFTAQADGQGQYRVAVPSGVYSVSAEAPGYATQSPVTVTVQAGQASRQDLALAARPRYAVRGRVAGGTGAGSAGATVSAVGTPFQAATAPDGSYRLDLPAGVWTLQVQTPGYRLERRSVTVDASQPVPDQDFSLAAAPSVLLVDADAWTGDPLGPYYRRALADGGFSYTALPITDTRAFGSPDPQPVVRLPALATLQAYDAVVWVHGAGSPGRLSADLAGEHDAVGLLTAYLQGGGRLLLVGQDIGYLDGFSEAGRPAYAPDFYRAVLHARFLADAAGPAIVEGTPGGLFGGLSVPLSAATGYRRAGQCGPGASLCPDAVAAAEGAEVVMGYPGADGAALRTTSGPGRLVYLAFNLDGASRADQATTLSRALGWLGLPRLTYQADRPQAAPGEVVTYTTALTSTARVDLPDVTVTATVPSALTVLPDSLTGGAVYDAQAGVVRWQGGLAAGAGAVLGFRARVGETAPGGVTLRSQAELRVGRDSLTQAAATVVDAPNLSTARLNVTPAALVPRGVLTYTLSLTNTGTQPVTGARLAATLPEGTTPLTDSLQGGARLGPTGQVEWEGSIPPSGSGLVYTWADSQAPSGPRYGWYDLSATAGLTPTWTVQAAPGQDDVVFGPLDLGFDFPFYGRPRRQIWVADNGWLSVADTPNVLVEPLRLPCAGDPYCAVAPRPVIAPFWYDLALTERGSLKSWTDRRGLAVVTWEGVPGYNLDGPYTFQAVLRADGEVLFQYQRMAGPVERAGGGLQDESGEHGVQVFYRQPLVRDGLVVRLVPDGRPPTLTYAVRLPDAPPPRLTSTAVLTDDQGRHYEWSATATADSRARVFLPLLQNATIR